MRLYVHDLEVLNILKIKNEVYTKIIIRKLKYSWILLFIHYDPKLIHCGKTGVSQQSTNLPLLTWIYDHFRTSICIEYNIIINKIVIIDKTYDLKKLYYIFFEYF